MERNLARRLPEIAHPSVPYNPAVANGFFRAGLIEAWGRGTLRMIDDCEKDKAPIPSFKYDFSGFIVHFIFKRMAGIGSQESSEKMAGEILTLIEQNPHIRIPQLAEKLGLPIRTVERQIKNLKMKNRIIRKGSTKSGTWEVKI